MCKYCEFVENNAYAEEKIPLKHLDSTIVLYKNNEKNYVLDIEADAGSRYINIELEILNCPMCGRKLSDE